MPSKPNSPPTQVGCAPDRDEEQLRHNRTVAEGKEQYLHTWGSGYHYETVPTGPEEQKLPGKKGIKAPKLRHTPGAERYERNPHEPIKVP